MISHLMLSLVVAAILLTVAIFSTTIYLHRTATHKALTLNPVVEFMFRLALFFTTGISTREWVAVHRKHHAFTDENGDPHSPHIMGFWSVQLGNVFHYIKEAKNPEVVERYASDIKEGWLFRHGLIGVTAGTISLCAIMGIGWGLLAAGIHGVMYVFVLSSSINGLCHHSGYKNFDNTAFNQRLLALATGGEGLHNNHHGYPRSPKFSFKPSEIDPAWPVIRLLVALKLATRSKTIKEIIAA